MSNNDQTIRSRRKFLQGAAALSLTPLLLNRMTLAQGAEVSKEQDQYQDSPKGKQKCSNCLYFEDPDGCTKVEGKISAEAWRALYAPGA